MSTQTDRLFDAYVTAQKRWSPYNMESKASFHRAGQALLRKAATDLGLKKDQYGISSDKGGVAVSGEIKLHTDKLYVQLCGPMMRDLDILYRSCNGRKDYGGGNLWLGLAGLDYDTMLATFRKVQER